MTALLTAPIPGGIPPLRWTVAAFHRARGLGLFDGRRAILLRGVLLEQGPMSPPHATAILVSNEALRAAFGGGWTVRVQLPLVLSLDTDPIPDFAVVRGGIRDHATAHPGTAGLVLEVSDTTLDTDITEKAELYATAGIADYWVLDFIQPPAARVPRPGAPASRPRGDCLPHAPHARPGGVRLPPRSRLHHHSCRGFAPVSP